MTLDWKLADLGSLTEPERPITYGVVKPGPEPASGGVTLIRGGDVQNGQIAADLRTVSPEVSAQYKRTLLKGGELLISLVGNPGSVAIVPNSLAGANLARQVGLVALRSDVNARFVMYALMGAECRNTLASLTKGSVQQVINLADVKRVTVPLPPVRAQQRIAEILSAYDDLIEVNRRRVALLEAMARGIFEEWFVRFRFPDHEGVALVETEGEALPVGWSLGAAGTVIDFDPRTRVPAEGKKPFMSMGGLSTSTSLLDDFEWRGGNSGAKFRNGDTLFARITPCLENGKTGLVRGLPDAAVGFGSTEFIVMRADVAGPAFTYCLARFGDFRKHAERGMSGASGRQRAKTEVVASFPLACPPSSSNLYERFEVNAWPMLELAGTLGTANKGLAASRDLLLPRLISGQLSVVEAERELALAA